MTPIQIKKIRDAIQRKNERSFVLIVRRLFVVQFDDLISKIKNTKRSPLIVNIDEVFNDWEKWDSYLKKRLDPSVRKAIQEGFDFAKKQAKLSGPLNYDDQAFQKALRDSLANSKYINDTTRNQVEAAITEFKNNGGTIAELTTHLQSKVLPSISLYRARTIATTTTTTSMNAGSHAMMQRFKDDIEYQQWFSQKDDKVRESFNYDHVAADGQRVQIGQPFIVSGEALRYPGDPSGSLGNIINCRCFAIPIKKK